MLMSLCYEKTLLIFAFNHQDQNMNVTIKRTNTSLIKKAISSYSIMQSSYVTMFVFHIHIELWLQNTLINVI